MSFKNENNGININNDSMEQDNNTIKQENNGINFVLDGQQDRDTNQDAQKEMGVHESFNQQEDEDSGLYRYTPDEMRATGNNILYQEKNDKETIEVEPSISYDQNIGYTGERQAATYGNYEDKTNSLQGGVSDMNNQFGENNNTYYQEQPLYGGSNNSNSTKNRKKKTNNRKSDGFGKRATKLVAGAVVFGLVAGVVFQGVNYGANHLFGDKKTNIQLNTTQIANGNSVSTAGSVSEVAQSSMPAIVAITSTVESVQYGFFNQQYKTEGTGSGSGIIIAKDDDNLYIATNNHVIEDATKVQVTFYSESDEGEVVDATIVGTDPDSDLAVVKVEVKNMSDTTLGVIKVATLGNSETVQIGQQVVAIGNALGYGQSVTSGYVSALNRQVQLEDKTMTLMQTDAAINPGNSGGALINMSGEVIGINSAKYSDSDVEGMGYAIPMATAEPILEDIMNESSVPEEKQAYLGITGATVSDQYKQYLGNEDIPSGVYVATVTTGSPAEEGGVYANDIIVKFNDREVSTMDGLQSLLSRKAAGEKITLTVKRQNQNGDYEEKELTITLGKKTESTQNQQSQENSQSNSNSSGNNGTPGNGDSNNGSYGNGNSNNSGNYNGNSGSNNQEEFWSFFN